MIILDLMASDGKCTEPWLSQPVPFGGVFAPASSAAAFGGAGASTAVAMAGGVAGVAFAGTAGVAVFAEDDFFGLLRESSMDRAFTSSRSSIKNSCKRPQR